MYLLDRKPAMVRSWEKFFGGKPNVSVVCSDFGAFMEANKVQCVVSPANSFGLMDGGYDYAISDWFGWELQKKVQKYIIDNFYGEQPVGSSFILDTGKQGVKLIHTPSMRSPDRIRDTLTVYQCTRTCLMTALKNGIESIVVPAFGGNCGQVSPDLIAEMMLRAYEQLSSPPEELNWRYVKRVIFDY